MKSEARTRSGRHWPLTAVCVSMACFMISMAWASAAHAGFRVAKTAASRTNISQDGFCDLNEAIASMNRGSPINADCVPNYDMGNYPYVILEATGSPTYELAGPVTLSSTILGGLSIFADPRDTGTVTIESPGGVFYIDVGTPVSIESLVLQRKAGSTTSGSIITNLGILSMQYVTVQNGQSSLGGGIYNYHGGVIDNLYECVIRNNRAGSGGGIYNYVGATIQTLDNTTIQNNIATDPKGGGGGIYADDNPSIDFSSGTIANNTAAGAGGGVYTNGLILIEWSTVSGNTATGNGGGIFVAAGGDLTLESSTVSGNKAANGGGGYNFVVGSSAMRTYNTTVSGNVATMNGGGFYANTYLEMHSSTIAFNSAKGGNGGGVYQAGGAMRTDGCIVAKNTHGATPSPDDYRGNPHGAGDDAPSLFSTATGCSNCDIIADPLLSPLAQNGGPTKTHAIGTNSPAYNVDKNDMIEETYDQRGLPRPYGAHKDLGAFEYQP